MNDIDLVEIITQALSTSENQMHSNESLGKQRMQAHAVLAALQKTDFVEWGVNYLRVTPYESEAEARFQLSLAQMDVPATLVTRIKAGEWVLAD